MKRIVTFALTVVVLVLGALIVFVNPMDITAIIFGMFLISVSILNLAVQIYFPPVPEQTVELRVVEEPKIASPVKAVQRSAKSARARKSAKKKKKR